MSLVWGFWSFGGGGVWLEFFSNLELIAMEISKIKCSFTLEHFFLGLLIHNKRLIKVFIAARIKTGGRNSKFNLVLPFMIRENEEPAKPRIRVRLSSHVLITVGSV